RAARRRRPLRADEPPRPADAARRAAPRTARTRGRAAAPGAGRDAGGGRRRGRHAAARDVHAGQRRPALHGDHPRVRAQAPVLSRGARRQRSVARPAGAAPAGRSRSPGDAAAGVGARPRDRADPLAREPHRRRREGSSARRPRVDHVRRARRLHTAVGPCVTVRADGRVHAARHVERQGDPPRRAAQYERVDDARGERRARPPDRPLVRRPLRPSRRHVRPDQRPAAVGDGARVAGRDRERRGRGVRAHRGGRARRATLGAPPVIAVTGGAGKAGRAVVAELLEHGEEVRSVDLVRAAALPCEQLVADLTDYGQTVEALRGARAVVHLAAIPAPGLRTDELTFRVNTTSTYNVFSAAPLLGLERVVWASSETVLGLPFEREQPAYAPIDEEHPPLPNFSYALSKLISEEMARQFHRWTGIPYVGLRFSNVMEPH